MLVTLHQATAWQWALVSTLGFRSRCDFIVVTITLQLAGRGLFRSSSFKRAPEGFGFAVAMSTSSLYNDLDKTMLAIWDDHDNGIYTMAYRIVDIANDSHLLHPDAAMPRLSNWDVTELPRPPASHRLLRRSLALGALGSAAIFLAAPLIPLVVGRGFLKVWWRCAGFA